MLKCPECDLELKIADREGVEIDYCGKCRGVWLDRGELDKIIDRANRIMRHDDDDDDDDLLGQAVLSGGRNDGPSRNGHASPRRKESWWSELFDL